MKNEPVVIEKIFNAPIEKVWKALTGKEEMQQWYFDMEEFKSFLVLTPIMIPRKNNILREKCQGFVF